MNNDLKKTKEQLITNLKSAEKKLRQEHEKVKKGEELYRFITENTSDVICYQAPTGEFNYVSPNVKELTGYSSEEYLKFGTLENVVPEDYHILEQAVDKLSNETETLTLEYRIFHKKGREIWVQSRIKAIRDKKGKAVSLLSSTNNITEQKELQLSLTESEGKYRDLYENSPAMMANVDHVTGNVVDCNTTLCKKTGFTKNEIIGKHILERYESRTIAEEAFAEFLETGVVPSKELRLKTKTQKAIDVLLNVTSVKDEEGNLLYSRSVWQDISEKKRAEEKLKESEERYRLIQENSMDAILLTSPDGRIHSANDAATKMFQWSEDEICKLGRAKLVDPNDPRLSFLLKERDLTGKAFGEINMLRKDGTIFPAELSSSTFTGKNGELLTSMIIRDVTERKNTEKEIKNQYDFLQKVIDAVPARVFWKDINSVYLGCNTSFINDCGKSLHQEVIGQNDDEMVWKEDADKYRADDQEVMQGKTPKLKYEEPFIDKDGKQVIWRTSKVPLINDEGKVIGLLATSENITEEKKTEAQLKQKQYHLENAQSLGKIGSWNLDIEKNELVWTDENYRVFGVPIGTPMTYDLFLNRAHPDDREYVDKKWNAAMRGEEAYDINHRLLMDDGEVKWVREKADLIFDNEGKCLRGTGFTQDITERKKATETVDAFFDQPMNIHLIGSIEGEILKVNKGWEETLGYTKEESIGKNIFDFVHPEDKESTLNELSELENGKTTFYFENRYKHKNGTFVTLAWSAIFNTSGKMLHGVAKDITQQKAYHEQLVQSEERYKALSENANHIILTHNFDGKITYANKFGLNFMNLTKEQVIGTNIKLLIQHEDDLEKMQQRIKDFMSGNFKVHQYVLNISLPSGDKKILEVIGSPIKLNNKIDSVLLTAYDITERKTSENKLRESEEKLRLAIDNSPLGITINDMKGNFISVNKAYEKIVGYSKDELQKMSFFELTHPDYLPKNRELFGNMASKKQPGFSIDKKYIRKNGSYVDVRIHAGSINDENGNALFGMAFTEDITERLKAEESIKSISRRLQLSTESANIGIWELDLKNNILDWDRRMFKLYGIKPDNFGAAYETWQKGLHPDDIQRADEEVKDAIAGKKDFHTQFRIVWPNGIVRHIEAHAIVTLDQYDNPYRMIGVNWDITDIKNTEINLIKAKEKAEESDLLKSAFLSNMSHEIRTPMNGILGFTELLKEPQLSGDQKDRYIQIIEKSGNRMLNTINDIVDISKIEAGQVEVSKKYLSLNRLMDEQFNFFVHEAEAKGLKLIYKAIVSDSESRIISDQHKLEGILTNLIKNAIKYTESGSITIGYAIKTLEGKDVCEFYVTDTGIGIPANRINAIFNRFEQADIEDTRVFEGSGLGLAISKSYVEMLEGAIGVSSKEGSGSKFTFNIPYIKQDLKERISKQNSEEQSGQSLNNLLIIVAEDDDVSKMLLETVLENEYNKIIYTSTGKETIDKCRENPDTDIILMDIKMPDMNGFYATEIIRKFNQDVIIIAQTAYGLTGDEEKAFEVGCDEYIAKPIKKESLLEKIQVCLNKKTIQSSKRPVSY